MRTKTLLLTAALSVAGLATSMAQPVYSVNAVGYVNSTLAVNKYNLIGNPLNGSNNLFNTVLDLADDAIGTVVYRWNNTSQSLGDANTYLGRANGGWIDGGGLTPAPLNPGEGFYILPLSAAANPTLTVTFVGEVPQGNTTTPLAGQNLFSFKSSVVPQTAPLGSPGQAGTLEFPAGQGDVVFTFDPNSAFSQANTAFGDGTWLDADGMTVNAGPTINVGQGFVVQQIGGTTTAWTRAFSVN